MATRTGGVYFPVDAGFCDTAVVRQVTRRLGHEGFHAYVRLLCALLNEEGGRLPLQLADEWEDLTERLGLEPLRPARGRPAVPAIERTRELVGLMEHYGALVRVPEGGYVFSPVVSGSMAAREETIESRRRGGRKSAEARKRKAELGTEQATELATELGTELGTE